MATLLPLQSPAQSLIWTALVSDGSELATEDPLALDYIAQQLGLLLLPGLTTRSSRAQAFAMVVYGLALAERAIAEYGYPATDEVRRLLFERWERFWALAALESRDGHIPRGDWDTMRGIRGARAAYRVGSGALPLDYELISRQQELGNLGAYLVPLRRSGLVIDGTLRPSPAALEIIDAFWDEPSENRHRGRYDDYAMVALDRSRSRIERTNANLTLANVGKHSRLTCLVTRGRTAQQRRLFEALFERARDPHTAAVARLVETAARNEVFAPSEILDAAIAGDLGAVGEDLRALLITARTFGAVMQGLLGAFDRIYTVLDNAGWSAASQQVAADALDESVIASLHCACQELLLAPLVGEIRRLPQHGGAFSRLVEDLATADAGAVLDRLLTYHSSVQRDRRRGEGWIRDEAGKLLLVVTSYTARPESPRFPSFKLDVVRTLLVDTGRLPADLGQITLPGVEA